MYNTLYHYQCKTHTYYSFNQLSIIIKYEFYNMLILLNIINLRAILKVYIFISNLHTHELRGIRVLFYQYRLYHLFQFNDELCNS